MCISLENVIHRDRRNKIENKVKHTKFHYETVSIK